VDEAIDKAELDEIREEFVVDTIELIEGAARDLVVLEEGPSSEMLNAIFRSVHTIKGTSAFLGFDRLSSLAHKTEDVLGKLRRGNLEPERDNIDCILRALDGMKLLVNEIRRECREESDMAHLLAELDALGESGNKVKPAVESFAKAGEETTHLKRGPLVSDDRKDTGSVTRQAGEKEARAATLSSREQTVRVDTRKLDELMNLVGELVLCKNRLLLFNSILQENQSIVSLAELDCDTWLPTLKPMIAGLLEGTLYVETITNNLQTVVMRVRLVPINRLFSKVPRLVRDLCAQTGKQVELIIEGGETELDKALIEALYDPLTHIMRNAVDHGIEAPEERSRMGKAAKGVISLKARQEANQVVIEILDDGRGIDVGAIKEKAVEKGFVHRDEKENLSAQEAVTYIFTPGFSTSNEVTSLSGRGVGMDVVKTNVERMHGQVYVDSLPGKWTKFTITLPLTLAIIKALLVSVGIEIYAIPLEVVLEVIKVREEQIKTIQGSDVLLLRDMIIPLVRLSKVVAGEQEAGNTRSIILCKTPGRPVGLCVDSVVGQEEVVIKALGEFLKGVPWIAGATIRGDGRVVLMLDIPAIVSHFCKQPVAA